MTIKLPNPHLEHIEAVFIPYRAGGLSSLRGAGIGTHNGNQIAQQLMKLIKTVQGMTKP